MTSHAMSQAQTRQIVRAYHQAWTSGDIATAGSYLAEDFTTRAPVGTYDTKDAYLTGLTRFRGLVTGLELLSELYGEGEATLWYDVHTSTPAGTLRTAEHFTLKDGKLVRTLLAFDATDWKAMLAGQDVTIDAEGRAIRPSPAS